MPYICTVLPKGRSSDGLERCSHIAKVIGSSPIVPTKKAGTILLFLFLLSCYRNLSLISRFSYVRPPNQCDVSNGE